MERICDGIYIDNQKMLLMRLNSEGENLYESRNSDFIDTVNEHVATFSEIDYLGKVMSIMPNTATKAEFILSNNCNMGCIYCYSAGNRNSNKINLEHAFSVIDRLISNSIVKYIKIGRNKKIYLSFHGGGEPSYEFDILKSIVEYATQKASISRTKIIFEITTNLSMDDNKILDFYIENNFFIHISMDGIEDLQNYQRPYADGSKSFSTVIRNISYISKNNILFSIRLTVTDYSISRIVESVKYFRSKFPTVRFIKLAPLQICDESSKNKVKPPYLSQYIKVLEDIDSILWNDEEKHISVFGEEDSLFNSGMCASVRFEQIIVSPEGIITSCHEDPLSDQFKYGYISSENGVIIEDDKVKSLKKDRLNNISNGRCSNCSIRLLCMGGCKQRMLSPSSDMFCVIEKYSLIKHIKNTFNNINPDSKNYISKRITYPTNGNECVIDFIQLGG
jgi:uncharacterized protein